MNIDNSLYTKISIETTMPYGRWKDYIQMPILIPDEIIFKQ